MAHIGKGEAAERLLAQAVKLHFDGGDPLATHLLAASAFRVCRDLVVKSDPTNDPIVKMIKPEYRRLWLAKFSEIANYLKHADKDYNISFDVPENIEDRNDNLIIIAIGYYESAHKNLSTNGYISLASIIFKKKYPEIMRMSYPFVDDLGKFLATYSLETLLNIMRTAITDPKVVAQVAPPGTKWT